MDNNAVINLTDENFNSKVLNSEKPFLVDFWAEWCGPCKILSPILHEVAKEYSGKIIIGQLNVDDNPNTGPKYNIRGIPALLIFKKGKVIATKVGSLSKKQLIKFIDANIG